MEICTDLQKFAECAAAGFQTDPAFSAALQKEKDKETKLKEYFFRYFSECNGLHLLQTSKKQEGFLCYYVAGEVGDTPLSPDMTPYQILEQKYRDNYAVLDIMCVAKEYQRQGFADSMIEYFLAECEKLHCLPLVEIFDTNHIKLYQKHGFSVAHRSEYNGVTTVVLEKK